MSEPSNTDNIVNLDPQLWSDPIAYFVKNQEIILNFFWNITYAIIILVLGWFFSKILSRVAFSLMQKAKIEPTVSKFIANIVKYAILAFVITASLSQIGVQTASFVAIIGAASFAVGMSLQGSLSNFASGVILLVFRPIKVGEFVDVAGQSGIVEEITIFTTTLLSVDNKVIIIPNSSISSGIITNFSRMEKRRVDFEFSIEYGSDVSKAKEAITNMFKQDERIIQEDGITVVVGSLGEFSVNLVCRVWVKGANYWDVYFDTNERILKTLEKSNIGIPFKTITVYNKNS